MQELTYDDIDRQRTMLNIARRRLDEQQGRELRSLREASGRSLRSVASEVGVSAAFLSDVELGRRGGPDIGRRVRKVLDERAAG